MKPRTPHSPASRNGRRDARVMHQPESVTQDHWVYLCYDAMGLLLYVGVTSRGFARFNDEHSKHAAWWQEVARIDIRHLPSREEALELEEALIIDLDPTYNTVHVAAKAYRIPDGPAPTRWLSFADLADWLDAESVWLRMKVKQGMPHAVVAGEVRFKASEVRSWLRR